MTRKLNILVAVVLLAGLILGCSNAQSSAGSVDRTAPALAFARSMTEGKFADATKNFDSVMAQSMSADQLKQLWSTLTTQCGAFKQLGSPRSAQEGGFDEVLVPMEFANATVDAKIIFDSDGKIGGLWIVPHSPGPADAQNSALDQVSEKAFDEFEVTVGSGEWKLPGTLTIPKGDGPFPAVVLVHGSGPNDRDESIGANKPFRDIASGLASSGVAVLRYDKRTKVYRTKMAAMTILTVKDEVLDDVTAAIRLLRDTKKVDSKRIFVLGHSLGGMLIPRIGKANPDVAGLIVLAGPTRHLEDCMVDQTKYLISLNSDQSSQDKEALRRLQAQVAQVKSPKLTASSPSIMGVPASYWLDLRSYNPAESAKSLKLPMLILQGGRDYQVTKIDFDGWSKALSGRPNVTLKLYPNLNHLFMEGEGKSKPQEYEQKGSVAQTVIDDLASWMEANSGPAVKARDQ